MPAKTCYQTFGEATKKCAQYPLKSGVYKLQEALSAMRNLRSTLVSNGTCSGSLCLPVEFKRWAKTVPHALAASIAQRLIPGVWALSGDDVPDARLQPYASSAERNFLCILEQCERVRQEIAIEGLNNCTLGSLINTIDNLMATTTHAIRLAESYAPQHPV